MAQGQKVPPEIVMAIRRETDPLFEEGAPMIRVKEYKRLAEKYGLGLETVAKIARYDTHTDVS